MQVKLAFLAVFFRNLFFNFWTGTSPEKLEKAEHGIRELSGLSDQEYNSYPVNFTFSSSEWKKIEEHKPIEKDHSYLDMYR